jgi:putative tryptophan/tyrosine transport system substrate-binding protein
MDRRIFLAAAGAALAVRPPRADQGHELPTVGVLMGLKKDQETETRAKIIEDNLAKRGWIDGRNLRLVYRFAAGNPEQMLSFSKELVGLQPDVIVAHSTPVVAALLQVTRTIPIVFVVVTDPVGSGFVNSLARPGGNVTGFVNLETTITGKYLSILRQMSSQIDRICLMYNPESFPRGTTSYMPTFEESAKQFHLTPAVAEVHGPGDIETALSGLGKTPGAGLIVVAGNFTTLYRNLIISLAAKYRIPTIYPYRYFVEQGGLMSYGVDIHDLFRRAPDYVDRILRGAKPGDLPVQLPTKFELVINLKTANDLGLTVPRILLAGADDLID